MPGLSPDELSSAERQLGRSPNALELAMLVGLWSEHCSYKTSKRLLRQLPSEGSRVVQGPGENAGVVDLGEGLLCCFKIESHNHPSAVEPVQGAATGVGGILRDVFAMGARPVAVLDALRFGDLDEAGQRHRFARVVEGVGGYGNCVGVPTVGGETYFDEGYRDNCLVNAMCVGLVEEGRLTRAVAAGVGNPVLLVGAETGRDGIHGAAFASAELDSNQEERRPAVQVGNPFLEKCLLEACLELAGDPDLVGLQDCGAAGLTSSCAEMAWRGGVGMELDLERVPLRERGMRPDEVMLSESQERMVLVVRSGAEGRLQARLRRWGLACSEIGRVLAEPELRVTSAGVPLAELPLQVLVGGCPERRPRALPPPRRPTSDPLSRQPPWSLEEAWVRLLGSPNCAEKRWIWRQYDHQVGDDTVVVPGADAAVLRLRPTSRGLAIAVDGAHRSAALDPARGTAIAVAEAVRNLACLGALPLALTNCLNFGSPDRPEVMWQLEESVRALAEAARGLGLPVVSGNVSLYNDFEGRAIPPSPVVGAVGLVEDVAQLPGPGFCQPGDTVLLLGPMGAELAGSEYQRLAHGELEGEAPLLDLELERRLAEAVREGIRGGLLASVHDCSLGGLAVALALSCLAGGLGARVRLPQPATGTADGPPSGAAAALFGESQGRYLVSCRSELVPQTLAHFQGRQLPATRLGEVGGDRIIVEGLAELPLEEAGAAHRGAIPSLMGQTEP
ncbi:MAG: phosphoribosylformylglycinamidine synthase subunit PurL [Candidatus Dormibacteria bacterium]